MRSALTPGDRAWARGRVCRRGSASAAHVEAAVSAARLLCGLGVAGTDLTADQAIHDFAIALARLEAK
jgi:hypothetical protein